MEPLFVGTSLLIRALYTLILLQDVVGERFKKLEGVKMRVTSYHKETEVLAHTLSRCILQCYGPNCMGIMFSSLKVGSGGIFINFALKNIFLQIIYKH